MIKKKYIKWEKYVKQRVKKTHANFINKSFKLVYTPKFSLT